MHINFSILNHFSDFRRGGRHFWPPPHDSSLYAMRSHKFERIRGVHGFSWHPWNFMESTNYSWFPRSFHGIHEVFMESTNFPWTPRSFHGVHELSMDSTKFSWNPRSFHGFHEISMESTKVVESTKILHETSTKFVESMEKLIGLCPLRKNMWK